MDDPRGELITLQMARLRGRPGREARRREKELLTRHRADWLGPIAPFLLRKELTFERGFVDAAHFNHERYSDVDDVLGDPHWATLRALRGRQPPGLTLHPCMLSLRECQLDGEGVEALAGLDGERPFTAVTLLDDGALAAGTFLEAVDRLPRLVELTVRGEDNTATEVPELERLEPLLRHPLAGRLRRLTLRTPARLTRRWLARLEGRPDLERLTLLTRDWEFGGWDLAFTRTEKGGPFDRLEATFRSGDYGSQAAEEALPALQGLQPGALAAVTINCRARVSEGFVQELRAELERLGPARRKLPGSW
jgi:hypothetical protein